MSSSMREDKARVLVIEDDPGAQADFCEILEVHGYTAQAVGSFAEAFEHDGWAETMAVILDRKLPDGLADELLPRLKAKAPDSWIIVVTGYPDLEGAIQALRRGAADYQLKPIDPEALGASLARVEAHRRLRREKEEAEGALRRERDFAQRLVDRAQAIVLVLDLECRIVRFNPYTERLLGCSLEAVRGQDWVETFVPAEYRRYLREEMLPTLLAEGITEEVMNPVLTRGGERREVQWSNSVLRDERGEPRGVLAVGTDITELRRAQGEQAQLAAIVESSDDAIIGHDLEGRITTWNGGAARMYGYEAGEVVGRSVGVLLPEHRREEIAHYLEKLSRGGRIKSHESEGLRRDGTRIEVALTASPVHDGAGRVIGGSLIIQELTTRKALERQVLEIATREQRRIGQDLHDGLGQELTGIAFLAKALRDRLAERGVPEASQAEDITQLVTAAIGHAKSLVRGLRPVNLEGQGLAAALVDLAEHVHQTHRIECRCEVSEGLRIEDPSTAMHLYYIASEAVNNAIQHGRARRIDLSIRRDEAGLTLTVRDDGVGIPPCDERSRGSGLDIMAYRAHMIGACFEVRGPGVGTEVACALPRLVREVS